MRQYSDYEIDILIDDLTEAALEAIDKAAAEGARAAVLASIEREASLLQAKAEALREAQRWRLEAEQRRKKGIWGAVITGLVCLAGGFVVGFIANEE